MKDMSSTIMRGEKMNPNAGRFADLGGTKMKGFSFVASVFITSRGYITVFKTLEIRSK